MSQSKQPKSGALERTGTRERISSLSRCRAVRRFGREARGYWRFKRGKIPRRTSVAVGMAEGEELVSNILRNGYTSSVRGAHMSKALCTLLGLVPLVPILRITSGWALTQTPRGG